MKLNVAGVQNGRKIFGCSEIEKLIDWLCNDGYEIETLEEGCLGYGTMILWSHNEHKYNFLVREVYLNEWSSGHTINRFSKITKALQKEIDTARRDRESEELEEERSFCNDENGNQPRTA